MAHLTFLMLELKEEGRVSPVADDADHVVHRVEDGAQVGRERRLLLGAHQLEVQQ